MHAAFAVQALAAIAPGLQSPAQWCDWAKAAALPTGQLAIDLPHVPAMVRRRLGHLARMAVSVADQVLLRAQSADIPVVWASRYGDAEKSIALLGSLAMDDPLSPTAFGLSVHNAIGAQHAMLRGMRANAVCVASSDCTPEAAVVEAVGLLKEGAPEVLVVCYDAPLPQHYAGFHDESPSEFAWALLLTELKAGCAGFSLHARGKATVGTGQSAADVLPHGLDVLHFLMQAERERLVHTHAAGQWMWERMHA